MKTQVSINWDNLTAYLVKTGNVCTMSITGMKNLVDNGVTNIGTLPDGYKPLIAISQTIITPELSAVRMSIESSGGIGIYNYSSKTGVLNVGNVFTYVCK